jgi:hypothetical protein
MRRLPLLSTPPSITIADEPLDGGPTPPAAVALASTDGFAVVPAWQAHSPRRLRPLTAAVPLIAVAVAAALWLGRDHDAQALRERPIAADSPNAAPAQALVVRAAPAGRAGSGRSGP